MHIQILDRQWRSLLADEDLKKRDWEKLEIEHFWRQMVNQEEYKDLAEFMLKVTTLPQSTAEFERTFSKLNNNKTKLTISLLVKTLKSTIKTSEKFTKDHFEINERLIAHHGSARER
ncbi:eukaryotic translation initiation factor 4e [Plakobranchus ocellatus]|uniref:Eukaryotic translation initiation factor 4e n=1 Tax=Plakobranchus ocellatus TaxID=259542 RepID=A0AAV4CXA0_9GAST|nr:eukaryotic translation initiation factor 4e [Plakobranchus ocellatus]